MKNIYKYKLEVTDEQAIEMPQGSQIIHVDYFNDEINLWAIVDPKAKLVWKSFVVHGTGHPCPETKADHIGTVIDRQRGLVWHVFNGN